MLSKMEITEIMLSGSQMNEEKGIDGKEHSVSVKELEGLAIHTHHQAHKLQRKMLAPVTCLGITGTVPCNTRITFAEQLGGWIELVNISCAPSSDVRVAGRSQILLKHFSFLNHKTQQYLPMFKSILQTLSPSIRNIGFEFDAKSHLYSDQGCFPVALTFLRSGSWHTVAYIGGTHVSRKKILLRHCIKDDGSGVRRWGFGRKRRGESPESAEQREQAARTLMTQQALGFSGTKTLLFPPSNAVCTPQTSGAPPDPSGIWQAEHSSRRLLPRSMREGMIKQDTGPGSSQPGGSVKHMDPRILT
jgi:hypothetical protein